jgi:hypothetical protein
MRSALLVTVVWSAVLIARPMPAFARPVGGGRPEDSCLSGEPLDFAEGSATLDRTASTRLADAAAWLESGAGRYAFLAAPEDPLAPARVKAAAERLAGLGIDASAVRPTSFAVLDPEERRTLVGEAALVVKLCTGPQPYARDWTRPPASEGLPSRSFGGVALLGVLFGLWVIEPGVAGRRFER